jgi:hypothetical protein
LSPVADAPAAPAAGTEAGAAEARDENAPPFAAGTSLFLSTCSFRC